MTTVYLVTKNYGDWEPIAVYATLGEAKALAPSDDCWEDQGRGVLRYYDRRDVDLFINPLVLHEAAP